MLIKKLHGRVFDVFVGNGFSQWTRVKKTHYGVKFILFQMEVREHIRQLISL